MRNITSCKITQEQYQQQVALIKALPWPAIGEHSTEHTMQHELHIGTYVVEKNDKVKLRQAPNFSFIYVDGRLLKI